MNCWPVIIRLAAPAHRVYRAAWRIRRVRRTVRIIVCSGAIVGGGAVPLAGAWWLLPPAETPEARDQHHDAPIRYHVGLVRANYTEIQKQQAKQRDSGTRYGYAVKPEGYPDLPLPETPFVGAVLIVLGWWGSKRGIERGPLYLLMGGWITGVLGALAMALAGLPYVLGFVIRIMAATHS